MHTVITTEENLIRSEMNMVSRSYLCNHGVKTTYHLFLRCMCSLFLWHLMKGLFGMNNDKTSYQSLFKPAGRS